MDTLRLLERISTIRQDFQTLADLMEEWRDTPDKSPTPIDRVVLYIDDLDRCSPQQVVDVLQAVHLLLALDLFVVVVGVDPRWLLHSLQQQYRRILSPDLATADEGQQLTDGLPDPAVWRSTPLDYLEKIFNIPFVLPGMNAKGFGTLIRQLSSIKSSEREPMDTHLDIPPPISNSDEEQDRQTRRAQTGPPEKTQGPTPRAGTPPIVEDGSEIDAFNRGAKAPPRPLTEPELNMLSSLAPLVRSPREAKRMLNLYRMLRSTQNLGDTSKFLGVEGRGGEFEAVAVLLGFLTASPILLGEMLSAPVSTDVVGGISTRREKLGCWRDVVAGLRPRRDGPVWRNDVCADLSAFARQEWSSLITGSAEATELVTLPDLAAFRSWGEHIVRFSFVLSPLAASAEPIA